MSENKELVRVRFAPSPTGHLHIGSFRSALFNYLFARHYDGVFLLRIEDTDLERSEPVYVDSIMASLQWANLLPDEPVVIQSERIVEHKTLIQQLISQGNAYYCYCTQEEVVQRYQARHNTDDTFIKYDGQCREKKERLDTSAVVRFALPRDVTAISYYDLIRGEVVVALDQLDDFIIARSDGTPMYNFVVVADDVYMRITHVIRGDDHISNTPKQVALYQALGYSLPQFAHIPLILGPDGSKLSKRDAATSVIEYKDAGYLPDALINYLARLGWAHGDQEIFSRNELIALFTLDAVGKSGAIFDIQKLNWINSTYMRAMSAQDLYTYILSYVQPDLLQHVPLWNHETVIKAIDLYRERCNIAKEVCDAVCGLYNAPQVIDRSELNQWLSQDVIMQMGDLLKLLEDLPIFTVDLIKNSIKDFCKERGLKLAHIAQPIRLAIVGTTASPGVFEMLSVVGKQESIQRIRTLLTKV